MRSKLQQLAGVLWYVAERRGKAGKRLDRELAIGCYVEDGTRTLRLGRQGVYPGWNEISICRAAFVVAVDAASRTYITADNWHVTEFTWRMKP